MSVPTPEVKEQLHMLPSGYTSVPGVTERVRHRMMANGWHLGTARFLMMPVLQTMMMTPVASPVPSPRQTALQTMLSIIQPMQPQLGPGRWPKEAACVAQAGSMWEHWRLAQEAVHPMQRPPRLEPGLQQCIDLQHRLGGSLNRMREEIVDEIAQMAEAQPEATTSWWQALPHHIAMVYYDKEHAQISQIPLLIQLLQMVQMPGLAELAEDLQQGFQVTGALHEGAGWRFPGQTAVMSFRQIKKHSDDTTSTTRLPSSAAATWILNGRHSWKSSRSNWARAACPDHTVLRLGGRLQQSASRRNLSFHFQSRTYARASASVSCRLTR